MAWFSPKETITLKWSMDDDSWSHLAQGLGRKTVSSVVRKGLKETRKSSKVREEIKGRCGSIRKSREGGSRDQGNRQGTHRNKIEIQLPAAEWGKTCQRVGRLETGDPVSPTQLLAAVILENEAWKQSGNDDAEFDSGAYQDQLISSIAVSTELTHIKRLELGRYEKIMAMLLVIGTFLIAGAAGWELYRDRGTDPSSRIHCSLIESSGEDQKAIGGPRDELGDGRVPGVSGSSPDGEGEAD